MYLALLFVPVYLVSQSVSHDVDSIQSLEVLGPNSVCKRIVKRSISSRYFPDTIEYSFYAFSKEFRLLLKNKRGLLSPEFEAVTFEEDNKNGQSILIDANDFYEGSTFGDAYSDVKAYIDETGMLTATIKTKNDIYIIEPAWRHLNDTEYGSSIVYKVTDIAPSMETNILDQRSTICPSDQYNNVTYPTRNQNFMNNSENMVKRSKRSYNFSRNRCPLKLVADYLFYKNIGGSSASATVKYLIALIDRVNSIFLETNWQDFEGDSKAIRNMGFVIKKIEIYKNFSQNPSHYNTDAISDIGKLLHVFSVMEGTDFNKFCLVHLFTYRAFTSGVLGLGYIAQPGIGSPGGMCCAASIEAEKLVYYNTAISSLCSTYGKTVVTREADLVTAHEFGHNWGSQHDPWTIKCSPDAANGGPYIMNTFSVSGYDENNKRFSPCSLRSVKAVLQSKSDMCFEEEQVAFCGNKRVEVGEDCDEDIFGDEVERRFSAKNQTACCTNRCKFQPGAVCSPKNSPCCTKTCEFTLTSHMCRQNNTESCREEAYCTGKHAECPESQPVADESPCLDDGECRNGACLTFCEKSGIDMRPCICENTTESCFLCCRPRNSTVCKPFVRFPTYPTYRILTDGTRCIFGHCQQGMCTKDAQDFIEHVWSIVGKWDINFFLKFMHNNVVGTVIIVSLIFWVPISCWISRCDKHKLEEHTREWDDWVSSYNGSVYFGTPAISTTKMNRINGFMKSNTDATL